MEIIKNEDCEIKGVEMNDESLLEGINDYLHGRVVDGKTTLKEIAEEYGIQL